MTHEARVIRPIVVQPKRALSLKISFTGVKKILSTVLQSYALETLSFVLAMS